MKLRYVILALAIASCALLAWPIFSNGENGEFARRIGWFLFAITMLGLAYDNATNRNESD